MAKGNLEAITCNAAVCWGPDEPLVIEEIQVEPPQSSEIRIKVLCASLCHTDILFWKGYEIVGPPIFPRVFGHEGVGVVESIGEEVTAVKEGDIVIPTYLGECRQCMACKSGKTNLCHKYIFHLSGLMPDNTTRMSVKGKKLYHLFSCSTWSQYTVVNVNYVVKVDQRVALADASLISCGFSTGFGAVWKEAKVERGSTVAVFGLGTVGLGGMGVTVAIGAGNYTIAPIGIMDLLTGRTLKGCIFGGIKPFSDLPIMVDKCVNKELQLDSIITHEVEMENINHALELVKQPECLKVVIRMEKSCRNQPSL